MRPVGRRESAITVAAVRFSTLSTTSIIAALKGTGDFAQMIRSETDRIGAKRVLKRREATALRAVNAGASR